MIVLLLAGGAALAYTLGGGKHPGAGTGTASAAGVTKTTEGIDFTVQPADGSTAVQPGSTRARGFVWRTRGNPAPTVVRGAICMCS